MGKSENWGVRTGPAHTRTKWIYRMGEGGVHVVWLKRSMGGNQRGVFPERMARLGARVYQKMRRKGRVKTYVRE